MSLPRKALGEGEEVWCDLRPHSKWLIWPSAALIAVVFAASYAFFAIPAGDLAPIGRILVLAAAAILVLWWTVGPVLRWRSMNYVLTNRRVVLRMGLLSRTGRDVPLSRVTDVSFSSGPMDRLLGCGTLTVESAGERGQLVLPDVPRVRVVQREIYQLIEREELRRGRLGGAADDPKDRTIDLA